MIALKVWSLCFITILSCSEGYKILAVFPIPSGSHRNLGDGVVRHLINDGHEVTYISPYPYEPASPKVRWIDVKGNEKAMPAGMMTIETIINKKFDALDPSFAMTMMRGLIKMTIENENVIKLLNDQEEQFDAVISEWLYSELPAGYAAVFNCPFIWVSTMDVHGIVLRLIDEASNPAYTADIMSANMPPFTFWQRVSELYTRLKVAYLRYMYFDVLEEQDYENYFAPIVTKRGRKPPPFRVLQYNASLMLGNSHVSLGQAVSTPQSYIAVGGYHVPEEVKPLPDNIQIIMDSAKHGVIYFSMGSNLKSKDIPQEIKENLLKMFGELKQTVLWKFEEDLPNKPSNVHILKKWAPQPGILSHPNTVLFITHGGLLSTTETIHFGIPIIGIPAFADQFINVARAVKRGFAQKVDLSYTMAEELKLAIREMTTNPRYAKKAKELSFVYHDRPVTPGKELVHWVKHVIKTRGAAHLRSFALNVPFYQKLYLDLLAVIIVVIVVTIKLLKRVYCMYYKVKHVGSKKTN